MIVVHIIKVDVMTVVVVGCPWKGNCKSISIHACACAGICTFGTSQPQTQFRLHTKGLRGEGDYAERQLQCHSLDNLDGGRTGDQLERKVSQRGK